MIKAVVDLRKSVDRGRLIEEKKKTDYIMTITDNESLHN
jgi:hypothetical protein